MQVSWVYILFTALVAVAVLIQAGVLLGMFIAMKAALNRMEKLAAMAEQHAVPALTTAKQLLDDVSPKLKTAATNVVEASEQVRDRAKQMNESVGELVKKTEAQADRVDEMITGTLDTIAHVTATVQRAVSVPVRQLNAMLDGLRAGVDTLRPRERAAADGAGRDPMI